jgi:hypothetical protein
MGTQRAAQGYGLIGYWLGQEVAQTGAELIRKRAGKVMAYIKGCIVGRWTGREEMGRAGDSLSIYPYKTETNWKEILAKEQ